ncbi:MAG: GntR family transcriptional regulator [Lachnospiraceae bacterium]|nr:GntR family transcriptional regulator [Lachnospiraceae bacterium]
MITLDYKSHLSIYEQIIEQVKVNVLKGYLKPGDAIPSVRKLAMTISVTPATVAKAYQELERQSVIETVRGKGTFIAAKAVVKPDERTLKKAKASIQSGVTELQIAGMSDREILSLVKEICAGQREG